MATTTNYGWETPDDTDLVKDGAAAMRTLGSAIDTSLAELKGGTTGQVLSKNSNTDMDFLWTTNTLDLEINAQTASYTAALSDKNKLVTMNVSSANDFLIPTNASVAFPVGSVINVIAIGTGTTTIKAVTPATTTISSTGTDSAPILRTRYSSASCIKVATDTWYIVGDLG